METIKAWNKRKALKREPIGCHPIETAPKDEMFIYCNMATKQKPTNSIGLAYNNVSGGRSCAYGSKNIDDATHWMPLPSPPYVEED